MKNKDSFIFIGFIAILFFGTLGYYFIENYPIIDALYMTVTTIATVGFGEIHPLSPIGRIFTILLIFVGFGFAFTALSYFAGKLVKGELQQLLGRRRMDSVIKKMNGHFILAGFGRTGQVIAQQFKQKKIPFVVIDSSSGPLSRLDIPYVNGDAANEEILKSAGIERAKGFISVVSNDASNAFAIMTARGLNPKLNIVTRALDSQNVGKLRLAGANKVIAPYLLGGTRIAQAVMNPNVVDFVELVEDVTKQEIELADILVNSQCALAGNTLNSEIMRSFGVIVVGIRKEGGEFVFQPNATTQISANDHLIVMGPLERVQKITDMVKNI